LVAHLPRLNYGEHSSEVCVPLISRLDCAPDGDQAEKILSREAGREPVLKAAAELGTRYEFEP